MNKTGKTTERCVPRTAGSKDGLLKDQTPFKMSLSDIKNMLNKFDDLQIVVEIQRNFKTMCQSITADALDLGSNIIVMLYRIYRCSCITDYMLVAFDFFKSYFSFSELAENFERLRTIIYEIVKKLYVKVISKSQIYSQGRMSELIDSIKGNLSAVIDSDLVCSIKELVVSLVGFKLFPDHVGAKATALLGKAKPCSGLELTEVCLTALSNVFHAVENADTMSFGNIFYRDNKHSKFLEDSNELISQRDFTYSGLPVEGKICRRQYISDLQQSIRVGEELIGKHYKASKKRSKLKEQMLKLRMIHSEMIGSMYAQTRPTPAGFCVNGPPGIGKGMVMDIIMSIWSKVKGREFDASHVYHRVTGEDYWSGYSPGSQPFIHYSEPGALHRKIAGSRGDPQMEEILGVVDNQPKIAPMAEIDQKGKCYVIPEAVILDTNVADMNLEVLTNNPSAVRRRFIYIKPTVKPEFRVTGTSALDSKKSYESDAPILDRWDFKVWICHPESNKTSKSEVLLKNGDIQQFTACMRTLIEKHIEGQQIRLKIGTKIDLDDYWDKPLDFELSSESDDEDEFGLDLSPEEDRRLNTYRKIWRKQTNTLGLPDIKSQSDAPIRSENPVSTEDKFKLLRTYKECYDEMLNQLDDLEKDKYKKEYETYGIVDFTLDSVSLLFDVCNMFWKLFLFLFFFFYVLLVCIFPKGKFTSVLVLKDARDLMSYRLSLLNSSFIEVFKRWVDFHEEEPIPVTASYNYYKYMLMLVALLKFARLTKSFTIFSQSTTVDHDFMEDELDSEIGKVEKKMETKLPSARKKVGNGVQWIEGQTYNPLPLHQNALKNEMEILNTVNRNRRIVSVSGTHKGEPWKETSVALGLYSDYAIMHNHVFSTPIDGIWKLQVYNHGKDCSDKIRDTGYFVVNIDDSQRSKLSDDLVIVRLRGTQFVDIRKYMISKPFSTVISEFGEIGEINGLRTHIIPTMARSSSSVRGKVNFHHPIQYNSPNKPGMCGTPIFAHFQKGFIVVGIHSANMDLTDMCFGETFGTDEIEKAVENMKDPFVSIVSQGNLNLLPEVESLEQPGKHAACRYEPITGLNVLGRMAGVPVQKPGKSKLRSSKMLHHAERLVGTSPFIDGHPKLGPPTMRSRLDPDGNYVSPYNNFVRKAGVVKPSLDPKRCERVINFMVDYLEKQLRARGIEELKPVDLDVAVNGFPEDFYLRAMNMSTSGGWGWPGVKRINTDPVELEFKSKAVKPNEEVRASVLNQLRKYEEHMAAHPVLGAQLKDEPRAWKKILTASTRVFAMSGFPGTIVSRMLLAPIYSAMVAFSDAFKAAIGINMHSTDVDAFIDRITRSGKFKKFFEYDHVGFDTSMCIDAGLSTNTVIYRLCERFGYNEYVLTLLIGLLTDELFPVIVIDGVLYAIASFQASGKYGTAENNSIRNLFLILYAWSIITEGKYKLEEVFDHIEPAVYGDDVTGGVSDEASKIFNNHTIRDCYITHFGMKLTSAAKDGKFEKFLSLDEISFLKRSFKFREDLGHWVALLDRESLMKAICYYLPSKEVSMETQMLESCVSVMRELFFYLSEEEFTKARTDFIETCSQEFGFEPDIIKYKFPTFSEIRASVYDDVPFEPAKFERTYSNPIISQSAVESYNLDSQTAVPSTLENVKTIASGALYGVYLGLGGFAYNVYTAAKERESENRRKRSSFLTKTFWKEEKLLAKQSVLATAEIAARGDFTWYKTIVGAVVDFFSLVFVVPALTTFAFHFAGFPSLVGPTFICVGAPIGEEIYKRHSNLGKHFLIWFEFVNYCCAAPTYWLWPLRLFVAFGHYYCASLSLDQGILVHGIWNTVTTLFFTYVVVL